MFTFAHLKQTMQSIKIPTTKNPVHELITQRWSARSFSDRIISDEAFDTILEAASWAASSMNEQPWKYLYAIRGSQAFEKIQACLMVGNEPWAKHGSHLIIALAKRNFDKNGTPNRHAMHDLGAANTNMLLQAASMGILGHMMGGFHMHQCLETFEIDPLQWEISCITVLGYPDIAEKLDEPYRTRELTARTRKSTTEISKAL